MREGWDARKLVGVEKGDGTGHGPLWTERTHPGADAFGVASFEEALRLRAGEIAQPILLMEGFLAAVDLPTISAQCLHT
ncbi:alanine racemase, partial [Salmonella enterica]|uniref:alanine racemase n=1 Tax=Salmonella enterica TaxID=28901 RepID=UPI00398C2539